MTGMRAGERLALPWAIVFLDTTDFSRVVFQFQPDFAPSQKAETEIPRD